MPSISRHNSSPALYQQNSVLKDTQSLIGNSTPYRNNSERYLKSTFS
jgi:hypothetical protein